MRYLLHYLLIAVLSLSPIACSNNPTTVIDTKAREETISSFLVTPDRNTLVVVGKKHHFIMNLQEPLRSIMHWKNLHKLTPSFGAFAVDVDQQVQGSYTLQTKVTNLAAPDRQFLEQHGFRLMPDGNTLSFSASIQGKRYLANNLQVPQAARFTKPYSIVVYVTEKTVKYGVTEELAMSPLGLAIDGASFVLLSVVLLPAVVLFPESFH